MLVDFVLSESKRFPKSIIENMMITVADKKSEKCDTQVHGSVNTSS